MASTIYSATLTSNSNAENGRCYVESFAAAGLSLPAGSIARIRCTFQPSATEGTTITNAYIGHRAGSGDAYDFSDTPVQLLFSGGASGVTSAGTDITTDFANFVYNKTSDLLIAFYLGGGSSSDSIKYTASGIANVETYYKDANEAAVVNKSGFTQAGSGQLVGINKIEVETAGGHKMMLLGVG